MNFGQDLPIEELDEKGKAPEFRLRDAKAVRELYELLKRADAVNARNRARVQAMFDGEAPYDERELVDSGQGGRTNLNFGEGEALLEKAMGGYLDVLQSPEAFVSVRTTYGEEAQRHEWQQILAHEITSTIRSWSEFEFQVLHAVHHFVAHGLGIIYWGDASDWRFRGAGLGDFYVPRQTVLSEDSLEVAVAMRSFKTGELYRKIADAKTATDSGWNVAAVKKALGRASGARNVHSESGWEELESMLKNNDLVASAKHAEVAVAMAWVREFDGRVTLSVAALDSSSGDQLLYQRTTGEATMQRSFVLFPFGLGTNAKTHGLRGLGHKIFPHIQISNQLRSQLIDGAGLASSIVIQPQSESDLADLALQSFGPYTVLAPGMQIPAVPSPNYDRSVIPVLGEMDRLLGQRVGQYTPDGAVQMTQSRSRFAIAAELEQATNFSQTSLDFFYGPFERVLREVVRRLARRDYLPMESGGDLVQKLRLRLVKAGVPLEALYRIDHDATRVLRAVGAGSPSARAQRLANLRELAPAMDEEGRQALLRDQVVTVVGPANADRYVPAKAMPRTSSDTKIAILENQQLMQGQEVAVLSGEAHTVHVPVHMQLLEDIKTSVERGEMPLEEAAPKMVPLFNHTASHLDMVTGDQTVVDRMSVYRDQLAQFGEIITNGMRRVRKMEEELRAQQEASAVQQGQQVPEAPQSAIDPEMQMKFAKHQAELMMAREKFELKQQLAIAEANTKREIADMNNANLLRRLLN